MTRRMGRYLQKRWFLVSIAALIAGGLAVGSARNEAPSGSLVRDALGLLDFPSVYVTAATIFLMAFSLDSRHLRAAARSPAPVLWASLVNYGFLPLAGWGLMFLQTKADFRIGLMIAVSVPCTLAAASVWTRKAGGNDAVSLMVTLLTNAVCFAVTPFWLQVATGSSVRLDASTMVVGLFVAVLVPALAAQAVRLVPPCAAFASRHKVPLGVVAQLLILVMVFNAAVKAGAQLADRDHAAPGWGAVCLVWGTCIALHVAALALGVAGGRALGFRREDRIAAAFAGSQKTLPVGVLLATDQTMFGRPDLLGADLGVPFAVFPMLMFHASQLFVDTAVADWFAAGKPAPVAESPAEEGADQT
ncbi:MAG: bile acid:sodium symporter [Planctomycetales bacterium]